MMKRRLRYRLQRGRPLSGKTWPCRRKRQAMLNYLFCGPDTNDLQTKLRTRWAQAAATRSQR